MEKVIRAWLWSGVLFSTSCVKLTTTTFASKQIYVSTCNARALATFWNLYCSFYKYFRQKNLAISSCSNDEVLAESLHW
jgi:hypothetical protein